MSNYARKRRIRTKYYRYCRFTRCLKSLPHAIEPEELKQLLSVIRKKRDKAIILMLLRTGMRIGELLRMKVEDINLRDRKVIIFESEKNQLGRVVYFSDDAKRALKAWFSARDPTKDNVFYGKGNRALSYAAARALFWGYLHKARLSRKGYTLHCLRHTYASQLLSAGMPLESLQQLLGHSSVEVTRRYARLAEKSLKDDYFRAMAAIQKGEIYGEYRNYI